MSDARSHYSPEHGFADDGQVPPGRPIDLSSMLAHGASIDALYDLGIVPGGMSPDCTREEFRARVQADIAGNDPNVTSIAPNSAPQAPAWAQPSEHLDATFVEPASMTMPAPHPLVAHTPLLPGGDEQIPLGSGTTRSILGQGGMGRVYLIYNEMLEMFRAVKIVTNLEDNGGAVVSRFMTEAKIAANLHHTNIVQCHAVGDWHGLPFIEMEYIKGFDISHALKEAGCLPKEVAFGIGISVCEGLAYAHQQQYQLSGRMHKGLVHRDLKPGNIRISSDTGSVKLMDFGIARPAEVSLHTAAGQFVGSFLYAAPEQLEGSVIDARTDVYACGEVLYEMLCGRSPFERATQGHMLDAKMKNRYRGLDEFNLKLPSHLVRVVHRCLQTDPRARYASSVAMLDAFEDAFHRLTNERPGAVVQDWVQDREFRRVRQKAAETRNGWLHRWWKK